MCEVIFENKLEIVLSKKITREDFDSFDLDQNGILFFEEWLSGQ